MRLNKAIASRGYCSRRKADFLIFNGDVYVDGVIEKNPARQIKSNNIVKIKGQILKDPCPLTYIILYKPIQYVCTLSDPQNRPTILDLLPKNLQNLRLCPAGRLDYFSEGLIILTNDGPLIQHLCHPKYHLPKIYEVIIKGRIHQKQLKEMRSGMQIEGGIKLLPVDVIANEINNNQTKLIMTLRQGINRQIRKMCAAFNLTILKLKRMCIGSLTLGDLKPGEWRVLSLPEIRKLRD